MPDNKRVLLIERLSYITYLYSIFFSGRFDEILFIDTSFLFKWVYKKIEVHHKKFFKNYRQIYHCEFLGSWYDQIDETGIYVNDKLFDKYSNNIFISSLLKFGKDSRYSLAIRKELYNRYTFERVKTFIFFKHLSKKYNHITFLPSDTENIISLLSDNYKPENNYSTPKWFTCFLYVIDYASKFVAVIVYPFILLGIAIKFLLNGISFCKIKRNTYNYGIDTFSQGIPWRVPYNSFFIYNKSDFHPSKILHVVRSDLTDEKTKAIFKKYHFPYAIWNKQKTPIKFVFSRILMDMVLKQTKNIITGLFSSNKNSLFLFPCLAISRLIIETQIFYYHYDVKVFISRDEYSSLHVIRTLVAHENNSHTIGYMHGDATIPGVITQTNILFDKYCIYGDCYRSLHEKGLAFSDCSIIGAGIYGLDKTYRLAKKGYIPEKYKELKKSYKILLIIGGPYNVNDTDSGFTKDLIIQYYKDILNFTDEYKDYYRVIKPAGDDRLDEDLKTIVAGHERVLIDKYFWTYKILLISDLTIGYGPTTVGLESIMAGKKTIYYDLSGYKKHAYQKYSPHLVVKTPEDLKKNLDYLIRENKYLDTDTLELIREEHGFRFDGQVVHRFRQLCRTLLQTKKN